MTKVQQAKNNVLPEAPDISMMVGAFAQVYVVPAYDVGDNNMNVPFVLNVANSHSAHGAAILSERALANPLRIRIHQERPWPST